jgi:hypothetical protein
MGEGPHIPAKLVVKRGEKHIHVTQKYADKNILETREGWRREWGGAMAGIVVEGKDAQQEFYYIGTLYMGIYTW